MLVSTRNAQLSVGLNWTEGESTFLLVRLCTRAPGAESNMRTNLTYLIILVDWAHVLILSFRFIFRHVLPQLPASVTHLADSIVYIKSYRVRPLSFSATFVSSHISSLTSYSTFTDINYT